MHKDLNSFTSAPDSTRELARVAELARVTNPVSPELEIAAVTDRGSRSRAGRNELLFERPFGYDVPASVSLGCWS